LVTRLGDFPDVVSRPDQEISRLWSPDSGIFQTLSPDQTRRFPDFGLWTRGFPRRCLQTRPGDFQTLVSGLGDFPADPWRGSRHRPGAREARPGISQTRRFPDFGLRLGDFPDFVSRPDQEISRLWSPDSVIFQTLSPDQTRRFPDFGLQTRGFSRLCLQTRPGDFQTLVSGLVLEDISNCSHKWLIFESLAGSDRQDFRSARLDPEREWTG
jgi:hypothetical protein